VGNKNVEVTTQLALETSDDDVIVEVHKKLVRKLKPHQVEGWLFHCHFVIL
jgi:hypothetical protein